MIDGHLLLAGEAFGSHAGGGSLASLCTIGDGDREETIEGVDRPDMVSGGNQP
jgi:hypothetical protein